MNLEPALNLSSELHFVIDRQAKLLAFNPAFSNALGYSKEELENTTLTELSKERTKAASMPVDGTSSRCVLLKKNGEDLQLHFRATVGENDAIFVCAGIILVQKSTPLARFRRSFDMDLLDIVTITGDRGEILFANVGFTKALGYDWDTLDKRPLLDFIHPEDRDDVITFFEELRSDEGQRLNMVNRCLSRNKEVKWFSWNAIYARRNIYAVAKDITPIKSQEIKIQDLLNQTMRQYEELSVSQESLTRTLGELETRNFELDQFVYKVSHDLRAPLTSILGLANLAKMDAGNAEQLLEYFLMVEKSTKKLDSFIKSLLDFSRSGRAEMVVEPVDFRLMIDDILEDLRYMKNYERIEKRIEVVGDNVFHSENMRLRIIFNNLISNAIKYQSTDKNPSEILIRIDLSEAEVARIAVSDNGIGIDEESMGNVFDMFFRGTEMSDGSGLGLYIVKQTVDKLNGTVDIISEYRKGTEITLTLPGMDSAEAE